jgi:hypothetical protein
VVPPLPAAAVDGRIGGHVERPTDITHDGEPVGLGDVVGMHGLEAQTGWQGEGRPPAGAHQPVRQERSEEQAPLLGGRGALEDEARAQAHDAHVRVAPLDGVEHPFDVGILTAVRGGGQPVGGPQLGHDLPREQGSTPPPTTATRMSGPPLLGGQPVRPVLVGPLSEPALGLLGVAAGLLQQLLGQLGIRVDLLAQPVVDRAVLRLLDGLVIGTAAGRYVIAHDQSLPTAPAANRPPPQRHAPSIDEGMV